MIFQLVYRSTATRYLYPHELAALLALSREKNAARQISGLLLYDGGKFLQLLEGAEAEVRSCFDNISRDERHKWISLVMTGPQDKRDFAGWSMAYRDVDMVDPPEGWNGFFQENTSTGELVDTSQIVRGLLLSFRAELAARNSN